MRRRNPLLAGATWALVVAVATSAWGQWDPQSGDWGKSNDTDVRVMTWNIHDTLCSTADKQIGTDNWTALTLIVAALQPDVLILQEAGDNSGNGTGSGVDSVGTLTTVINLFFNGGADPYLGGQVTAYVQHWTPGYALDYPFVSTATDGYNRNVVISRYPFIDLNGDGNTTLSDIPTISADEYAPGGSAGIRGFQIAELDLPDADYAGDLVIGNAHLKAYSDSSSMAQRLNASKNVAYVIDYWLNGAGTGTPDPHGRIWDSPAATSILDDDTPMVWGGDWNEDESSNGRDGPALWMVRAEVTGGNDGTDRDRGDSTYDSATCPITGNDATYSSSKLDYLAWQDSIASVRRQFIFNTSNLSDTQLPSIIYNNFGRTPRNCSGAASDHRPVIIDFILPEPSSCMGDLNGDNTIDLADLQLLLSAYGTSDGGDLDGDSDTDLADLQLLLSVYGTNC